MREGQDVRGILSGNGPRKARSSGRSGERGMIWTATEYEPLEAYHFVVWVRQSDVATP
jgi:hypothetical protein